MKSKVFTLCVVLCVLLNACVSHPSPTAQPIAKTYTPTAIKASPTSTRLAATETALPPTPIPTVIQSSEASSPVFVYLAENTLLLQVGTLQPKPVGVLEDLGEIRNALMVDDTIFLIRDFGLQRLNLKDGSSKILLRFEDSIMSGQLLLDAGHSRLFYGAITYYTSVSMIGFYDLKKETINSILTYSEPLGTLFILGATEDGQNLILLPHGQDPSIGDLNLVNIKDGTISIEWLVNGYGYAVLAPDSNLIAMSGHVFNASDELENRIYIYHPFSIPTSSPKEYKLPSQTSVVGSMGFYWSADSNKLYFLLSENISDPSTQISDGLWVLDVITGTQKLVTDLTDITLYINGINPDGTRILVRSNVNNEGFLINSNTGEIRSFSVPVLASFVGWK